MPSRDPHGRVAMTLAISLLSVLGCGGECPTIGPATRVRDLETVPIQVGVPAGWKVSHGTLPEGGSEALTMSDEDLRVSLTVVIFDAEAESVFVSDYESIEPATVVLGDGAPREGDRVFSADGGGYRVMLRHDDSVIEIAARSEVDGCDPALQGVLRFVHPLFAG